MMLKWHKCLPKFCYRINRDVPEVKCIKSQKTWVSFTITVCTNYSKHYLTSLSNMMLPVVVVNSIFFTVALHGTQ